MASGSGDTNMQTPHDALQPVRDVIRQAVDRLVLVENNQVTMTSQIAAAMNLIDDNRKKSEAEVIEYLGKMKEEGTNRFAAIKKQEEQFESDIKHTQQVTSDWVKKIMAEKTETIDALSQDVQMQRQKDSKDVENHFDTLKIEIATLHRNFEKIEQMLSQINEVSGTTIGEALHQISRGVSTTTSMKSIMEHKSISSLDKQSGDLVIRNNMVCGWRN